METLFRARAAEAERQSVERRERILAEARAAVKQNGHDPNGYIAAAQACKQLGRLRETLEILSQGVSLCAPSAPLYEYYIERLEKCNRTEEAIATARQAMILFPDELIFRLREALLLPILYDSQHQLDQYRQRYTEGLNKITREIPLSTATDWQRALVAIGKNANKYLGYQGHNDRKLQEQYGGWVHQIMAANFPLFAQSPPMPPLGARGQLRIGYVSARFGDTSVTKAFLGWLHERDRERITAFAYHASQRTDVVTDRVRNTIDYFRKLGSAPEDAAATIRDDELHLLVFLDVGMSPYMAQLAALRLAPITCAAWDYPVTSGLPSLDYFLSSEAMEPENAQDHYSEKLVLLPGLGVHYAKPVIPIGLLFKSRQDFGIREDAVVYLISQSVFKSLPAQDQLFAQIARLVPNSQFVFLVTNEIVRSDLERRLGRAFAAVGLKAADHCVLLPEMAKLDYWNLHLNADVVLDTTGWSGGVSTFEAVALGSPVVTLPGSLMRGRQSSAILSCLDVTETIAQTQDEYVKIAVRLGRDALWRQNIVERMAHGHSRLYSDTRCVRALEDFFRRVVDERLRLQSIIGVSQE
jgi:predicted O-linked N-acetylglucosamine transferase (SPINDLY family)